jgi:hypothetical protein
LAVRIKSKWTEKSRAKLSEDLIRENAQALAFIYWRVALDNAKNLHGEKYIYDNDEQRVKVIAEYLAMFLQMSDRLAYGRIDDESRQAFITTLAMRLSDHMQDNATDLFGEGDYRSSFIDMLNRRSAEYAEYEYSADEGPSYSFMQCFGSKVQDVMGDEHHDNKWIIDQIMDIDGPEAIEKASKALIQLFE